MNSPSLQPAAGPAAARQSHPPRRTILMLLFLSILLALAVAIRVDDITDLPLDFHSTRQLRSALIARGMYLQDRSDPAAVAGWQRQVAAVQEDSEDVLEPRIMETLAVAGYRLVGSEQLWIPRLLSALFWVLGAIPLFLLARSITSTSGAVAAIAFYLFLPYAIISSRSFMPDPLMVALTLWALWAVFCWRQSPRWPWAVFAGLLCGAALFVKVMAVFPLLGGIAGLIIGRGELRKALRDPQAWVVALLAGLPVTAFLFYGMFISGSLARNTAGRFFPAMLIDPIFYFRWEGKIGLIMGHPALILSLLGLLLITSRPWRYMLIGLWGGYILLGLIFDFQISSHDYYSLPLIPIAALSLVPYGDLAYRRLQETAGARWLVTAVVSLLVLAGAVLVAWDVHVGFKGVDYRPQAAIYEKVAELVGRKSSVVALTDDYGFRLAYWGWMNAQVWPSYGDLDFRQAVSGTTRSFQQLFKTYTSGKDYFVITWFEELDFQPELRQRLYSTYPIYAQGDGYVIFDLKHPLQ